MLRSSAVLPDAILGLLSPETVLHWCSPDALGDGQEQSLSHQARLWVGGEGGGGGELDDFLQSKACWGKFLGLKEEA